MITRELGDTSLELESGFIVDLDDLGCWRYSELCRCSEFDYRRFL